MQTDADLIDEVRQGKLEAYGVLVTRYERLVRAAVLHVTHDRDGAEDLVQDAFLAAFESLGSLRQAAKFGPWLLSIARRKAARSARSRLRAERCVGDLDSVQSSSDGQLTEASQRLLELVGQLPDHERVVVGLRYFEGHSVQEIAAITGRPVGTVTKQLSRAYGRLRRWLDREMTR